MFVASLRASRIEPPGNAPYAGPVLYRQLTGQDPGGATTECDGRFDRHVFASILAVAAMEGGAIASQAGLAVDDLASLIAHWFPQAEGIRIAWHEPASGEDSDEIVMVRGLLLAHRSTDGNASRWLAAMIARRSMEPNHLWEDLGLRDRAELSRLLTRHFAPLARRNTRNMRWKRFFYRTLCEDDGLVMCSTPSCAQCNDFDLCFGDESGESRLAQRRRLFAFEGGALNAMAAPAQDGRLS